MNPRTWHPGPPPHVGWWIASISRSVDFKRHWDGNRWSKPVQCTDTVYALHLSALRPVTFDPIEWTVP